MNQNPINICSTYAAAIQQNKKTTQYNDTPQSRMCLFTRKETLNRTSWKYPMLHSGDCNEADHF